MGVAIAADAQLWIAGGGPRYAVPAQPPHPSHIEAPRAGKASSEVIAPVPANPSARIAIAPRRAQGSLELEVIAALHRIGADTGEVIEIHPASPGLEVVATSVDLSRKREIREALSHISDVQLRLQHPERQAPAFGSVFHNQPHRRCDVLTARQCPSFQNRVISDVNIIP